MPALIVLFWVVLIIAYIFAHFPIFANLLLLAACLGVMYFFRDGLYAIRDAILGWYFALTPHPATDAIYAAVNGDAELDHRTFADLLRTVPDHPIERQVRERQAQDLAALIRSTEAALRKRAEETIQRIQQEADYRAAQSELHKAAIDQQLAKARADTLAKVAAFMGGTEA